MPSLTLIYLSSSQLDPELSSSILEEFLINKYNYYTITNTFY